MSVKEVLDAIKKTAGIKDKIQKELGLSKVALGTIIAEDMYLFDYNFPESENRSWAIFHGKCIDAGQKPLKEWGYVFIQTAHMEKTNKKLAGTKCTHCGEQLDKAERARYVKERDIKLKTAHAEYLEEKEIRAEWEAEQILLGKL